MSRDDVMTVSGTPVAFSGRFGGAVIARSLAAGDPSPRSCGVSPLGKRWKSNNHAPYSGWRRWFARPIIAPHPRWIGATVLSKDRRSARVKLVYSREDDTRATSTARPRQRG